MEHKEYYNMCGILCMEQKSIDSTCITFQKFVLHVNVIGCNLNLIHCCSPKMNCFTVTKCFLICFIKLFWDLLLHYPGIEKKRAMLQIHLKFHAILSAAFPQVLVLQGVSHGPSQPIKGLLFTIKYMFFCAFYPFFSFKMASQCLHQCR